MIRTAGLGPINARTSRLTLMIPLTCVARAHLVNPKTGKLWALMTKMRGVLAFTQRALRSYGAVGPSGNF